MKYLLGENIESTNMSKLLDMMQAIEYFTRRERDGGMLKSDDCSATEMHIYDILNEISRAVWWLLLDRQKRDES